MVLTETSDVILLLNVELKYYRDFLKQSRVYLPEKSTWIFEKPKTRQNVVSLQLDVKSLFLKQESLMVNLFVAMTLESYVEEVVLKLVHWKTQTL